MSQIILPAIALISAVVLSTLVIQKAMNLLSGDQKAAFAKFQKKQQTQSMVAILIIVGLYLAATKLPIPSAYYISGYVILVLFFIALQGFLSRKWMMANEFPSAFTKAFLQSTLLRGAGVVVFIYLLISG